MQPLEPDDPRQLGNFQLLGQLGAGGMGKVYLGRTPGGRTVAVKVVRADLARDSQFRERFRQEVTAARRVGGEWTAPVLDADTEGELPWVATGFVAGPSLGQAVREHGPLPGATVRLLGVGLAEALARVHELGLVHRDVKPSNVLLTLDGPRLIDFGIARALDAATSLTQTGHVVGSPGYMSPEQAQGQPAGPPSDVFSLGAVLALAATGRQPFGEGVSGAVLLYRVLHEQPDLSALDYPLRAVILACMAKHPDARPTPRQLRERLDPEGTAAERLGRSNWLTADLAASVGRTAVRLLDLESDRPAAAPAAPGPPAAFGPPQPGAYGPTAPYSYSPPTPPPASVPVLAPTAAPARKRRGPLIGGIAAAVLVLGGLAGYGIANLGSGDGGSGGGSGAAAGAASVTPDSDRATDDPSEDPSDSPSPSPSDSDSPSPKDVAGKSASAAPDGRSGFLGEWGATIGHDKAITVRVLNTRVNDQHAGESHLETADGYCEGTWTLVSASESKLSFTSRLGEHNVNCDVTGRRELELLPDGTLRYTVTSDNSSNDPLILHRID